MDTNVLSAVAPARSDASHFVDWMDRYSGALYLSAVTIAEIEDGIAKLRRQGGRQKAGKLTAWLDVVLHLYSDRIIPFDAGIARVAGGLSDRARSKGLDPGFADIIIAATALHRELTLLTRNTKDFQRLGVALHNPFTSLPAQGLDS